MHKIKMLNFIESNGRIFTQVKGQGHVALPKDSNIYFQDLSGRTLKLVARGLIGCRRFNLRI